MTSDTAYIETNRSPFKGYGYNLKYSKDDDECYSSSTTIIQIGGGNDSDTSSSTENDNDCCPFTGSSDYEPLAVEKRQGNVQASLDGSIAINSDEDVNMFIKIMEHIYALEKQYNENDDFESQLIGKRQGNVQASLNGSIAINSDKDVNMFIKIMEHIYALEKQYK